MSTDAVTVSFLVVVISVFLLIFNPYRAYLVDEIFELIFKRGSMAPPHEELKRPVMEVPTVEPVRQPVYPGARLSSNAEECLESERETIQLIKKAPMAQSSEKPMAPPQRRMARPSEIAPATSPEFGSTPRQPRQSYAQGSSQRRSLPAEKGGFRYAGSPVGDRGSSHGPPA